jgi:hypothetical protein
LCRRLLTRLRCGHRRTDGDTSVAGTTKASRFLLLPSMPFAFIVERFPRTDVLANMGS